MLYLANPCDELVRDAMRAGLIGMIDTPRQGNVRPPGVVWCADNGAFSDKWDQASWERFLIRNAPDAGTCLFAVAPDVVADAAATLERSAPFLPWIRDLGYPAAFVAQDGLEDLPIPWDTFDVLFVGGSTEWKLGAAAREIVAAALDHGKRVHMGRVNSEKRWRYARNIGCHTADGTILTRGSRANLPRVLAWIRDLTQLYLPEGTA